MSVPIQCRFTATARQTVSVLELFPESAELADGELALGGLRATQLAREFGTPLLVYCEQTLRSQAAAYAHADPEALVVYGTKAFANVAIMRLFGELGFGADVSTLGELEFAQRAGIPAERIVFHGKAILPCFKACSIPSTGKDTLASTRFSWTISLRTTSGHISAIEINGTAIEGPVLFRDF